MVRKKSEQQAGLQPLKVEQSTNTSYLVAIILCFLAYYFLASERSLLYLPQPKIPLLLSLLTIKTSRKFLHWLNFTLEKSVWALVYSKPRPY